MSIRRRRVGLPGLLGACLLAPAYEVLAAAPVPRLPASPREVIARVDPAWRGPGSLAELRRAWRAAPGSVEAAAALTRAYLETGRRRGDLRYLGYARAVLAPWQQDPDPPPAIAVLQARTLSRNHDFAGAARVLEKLLERAPAHARGWLDLARVHLSRGDPEQAAAACRRHAALAPGLLAATCLGMVEARRGADHRGWARIARAMARRRGGSPAVLAFALGELADIAARRGRPDEAALLYEQALERAPGDASLLARLADTLLADARPERAATLLEGHGDREGLAVRAAIAARRAGRPWDRAALRQRLASGAVLGAPQPELEARVALDLDDAPREALAPAIAHFHIERGPDSALLALRAASAARVPWPSAVTDWVSRTGLEDARIASLATDRTGARP